MKIPIFQYPLQSDEILKRCNPSTKKTEEIEVVVKRILQSVRADGDRALEKYTIKFDGVKKGSPLKIDESILEENVKTSPVSEAFRSAVEVAIENITAFHRLQTPRSQQLIGKHGETLTLRTKAIERAGIYVPGGTGGNTPLISSLLMNHIPAKIAGVKEIFCVSPPQADGTLNDHLLYVLGILGIHEVYAVGGAQAIAAMAYGTQTIPKADIISGPGNAYVNEAKRNVLGAAMIDGLYGNSELVVISDGSVKAAHIAADILSQCEHAGDELALLITDSLDHAKEIQKEIDKFIEKLPRKKEITSSLSSRSAVAIVDSWKDAIALTNAIAPEHLEILTLNAEVLVEQIDHAGAIFIGEYASEPIGDYICGTNHVLPTAGAARFSSPLGVYTFVRRQNIIRYNEKAFRHYAPHAAVLAQCENLKAHENALRIRMKS